MNEMLVEGSFFRGRKAALLVGDHLITGFRSNYRPDVVVNHISSTAMRDCAGLAAGDGTSRVYAVEPVGAFENDPHVTGKKSPRNPTRSYRSREVLRTVGEVTGWTRQTPVDLRMWRDRPTTVRADGRAEVII
ncbi:MULTISPECIES: NAD(+)--rifampin ADP-ribosyltransferase [unclassified Streptomyces]|uniref:NAD(+)--rifampin ADP-ribosyltransferase n=1 Tax=unclassified Streptomyces TaxID=2593676 RepID=UPI000DB91B08|nr:MULTISPECIES: NAD(+)--rifampin ADP-ribosyltransferase [unclassified Streptomyces]MYT69651.1 NAD(+)--rifampin ADP-ribosyltransferase [Streptomyces sp. SID8367]RAJ70715.1 rifampin ADP-ribosylating transferase [Streptomyces sp. PsTaAH-137]